MASGEVTTEHDIVLTAMESQIFDVIRGALRDNGLKTVVRVAGGWVRDKVLGLQNDDIDIAIDDMTGVEFAEVLNAHLAKSGEATHKVSVIQANPEQSKHLETATVKILGEQIDLVNLRAEEYSSESRIPTVRFGSAEEDAMRRDFTINALFFNVNEESIEDLTGHGFADLGAQVLRTPLAPEETLLDDPLRVLRAVRFAARFGFRLAPDLRAAIELPAVRLALASKISRERIGSEVDGMLASRRPVGALRMLHARNLLPAVLALPSLLSGDEAQAAARTIKSASDAKLRRKPKKGGEAEAAPATDDPEALSAAMALLEPAEPTADAPAEHVAIADAGMAVVDAVDALAAASSAAALSAGPAAASASSSGAAAAGTAADAASPPRRAVKVVRGTALDGEDAARSAAILAERAEAQAGAAAPREAQQLPDHMGGWAGASAEGRRVLLLAACLWPLRDSWMLGTDGKERGKPMRVPAAVLRISLKRRAKDGDDVLAAQDAVPLLREAAVRAGRAGWMDPADVSALVPGGETAGSGGEALERAAAVAGALTDEDRASLALGIAVKRAGELAHVAAALAAALAASEACPASEATSRAERLDELAGPAAAAWVASARLVSLVESKGLSRCWERKPVVDGKALRAMGVRPGPAMRPLMDMQSMWMLAHPRGTDEDCKAQVEEAIRKLSD